MSERPERDPVVHSSLSRPLVIWSALLVVVLAWALYDETYGIRPWKGYEARFRKLYAGYLANAGLGEAEYERRLKASPEYHRLDAEMQAAEKAARPEASAIDRRINSGLEPKILALNGSFQEIRSRIAALTYEIETTRSAGRKNALRGEIASLQAEVHRIELPGEPPQPMNFDQISTRLQQMKDEKARLLDRRVEVMRQASALRAQRDQYLSDRIPNASLATIASVQHGLDKFDIGIRQIHVADIDLVDRCESCHLGTREPIQLTAAAMGGEAVFTSHPDQDLLKIHDPEKFGCTPCHGGNGVAVTSVEKAHGENEHWLWPLHHKENIEAGCQQCHAREIVTEMAGTLNQGREIFRLRGCAACHRYDGFDREAEEMTSVSQQTRALAQQKAATLREAGFRIQQADQAATNAEARRLYQQATDLQVESSQLDAKIDELDQRSHELVREEKKTGPDLKEVRMKLRKEWIPVWLKDPHAWREGTKMPTFRLDDSEIRAISAFLWQSGVDPEWGRPPGLPGARSTHTTPEQTAPGDPAKGKEAFETRGCLACHSMGEGAARQGGTFAANLSREGEKANYDYLVRWILNPRQRTAPYCPFEKRDLTPADYARHNLPYVFDLDHDKCPNDGHQLQVEQMTPMPSLRLSQDEARDIASYLMTCKRPNFGYAPAAYMDDPALKARGLALVRNYGCAGCHEIAGLEEEQRIGTELTREGSKPLERFDFALLLPKAEAEGWHTHKGFFDHKLTDPAVFDQGKEKAKQDRLKMPNFNLSKPEIDALSTLLEGSVDPTVPESYTYAPADQRADIIEGWWVVRKYNCMGCHRIHVGQTTVFDTLPRYRDPDWKDQVPPTLIGEGARVRPDWLMRFLENPALSDKETNRDGVRRYLKVRMPTFYFSGGEVRKLVRFFAALSSQPEPFVEETLEPLTAEERTMARALFTSPGAPCLKCHMTGDPAHDAKATAPDFTIARERLQPDWTRRWMLDPAAISPGTAMPSGLFTHQDGRWVFAGQKPSVFNGYQKDEADLLLRYMFEFTPQELSRLRAGMRN